MASNISKSAINKNNKLNTGLIWASNNNYIRKIFGVNAFVIKNGPILTWLSFFVDRRILRFFIRKYILSLFLN